MKADDFEEELEWTLGLMTGVRLPKQFWSQGPARNYVLLSHFDCAEPMGLGSAFDGLALEAEIVDWVFGDVVPRDVGGKVDLAVVSRSKESEYLLDLRRVRNVPLSAIRGVATRVGPHVLEVSGGKIHQDKSYIGARGYKTWLGGRWVDASSIGYRRQVGRETVVTERHGFDEQEEAWDQLSIAYALGREFNRRYEWRVACGWEGLPRLSFATDPVGAREIFRLRDIPEGKQRRDALKHWVRAHFRRRRKESVGVRRHLRGAENFTWNGFSCQIFPAQFDIDEATGALPRKVEISDSKST